MSRILAQPIFRDALLLGKFLAGLATLSIGLLSLWLLVIGLGLLTLGIPPGGSEVARALSFLLLAVLYGGLWLAIALFMSTVFRSPATAALSSLGLWLFFSVLWPMLSQFLAAAIYPNDAALLLGVQSIEQLQAQQWLSRISPGALFEEAMVGVLSPMTRSLGLVFPEQMRGAVNGAPLGFVQSLLLVWPQVTGLVAAMILLFVGTYVSFQRQEVRA